MICRFIRMETHPHESDPTIQVVPQPLDEEASNLPKFKWHRKKSGIGTSSAVIRFPAGRGLADCPDCAKRMTSTGSSIRIDQSGARRWIASPSARNDDESA